MAIMLMGYDVESIPNSLPGDNEQKILFGSKIINSDETSIFVEKAKKLHKEMNVPCTMFITGQVLEREINNFKPLLNDPELFDLQNHTYSHIRLKTVLEEGPTNWIAPGATLDTIYNDVKKANEVFKNLLGIDCIGLCGPYNYYRGLSDRPDILKILHDLGIRFTRTYGRNAKDYYPVEFDVQPYWYKLQKFGDILEIPVNGWIDIPWKIEFGWKNLEGYLSMIKANIDKIVGDNLVLSHCQHDWTCRVYDQNLDILKKIMEYALSKGVKFMTHKDFYVKMKMEK
jgi:peptidoglycan/xylan/chitin deacetylase (PgdA/CDA1 family)